MKTILIQGAMESEIEPYVQVLKNYEIKDASGYRFYVGEIENFKVIVALTGVGIMNATASTVIALLNFEVDVVINQGVCGAHLESLKIGDVIVGKTAAYINKFQTEVKGLGEGSDALSWIPMKNGCYRFDATQSLVDKAEILKEKHNLIFGVLGTGDMFSREADRINQLHKLFGEITEDMESVAVYKVCSEFEKQFIGFRIVSNNEFKQELGTSKSNRKDCMDKLGKIVLDYLKLL